MMLGADRVAHAWTRFSRAPSSQDQGEDPVPIFLETKLLCTSPTP